MVDDRRVSLFVLFMGSGDRAVLQVPMLYRLAFDPFLLFDDGFRAADVGVGWGWAGAQFSETSLSATF